MAGLLDMDTFRKMCRDTATMTTMAPATAITQLPPPTAATTLSVEDIVARRITDLRGLKLPIRITTAKCPRFSWDIVVHAYSIEAKAIINAFRLSYAALFREHLKALCGTECAVVAVGTVDNITAESDIDLNIQLSDGVLKLDIVRLYAEIHRFHSRHFVQPYTDLFDMNIYGTDFRMRACKTGCYDFVAKMRSQRYWSFLRLVQLNIGVSLMPKDIVRSVRHMVIALPTIKPEEHYVEYLYRYLEIKLQNRTVDEQSAAAFSLTKYFERDTYRSVGAYLHIVYNDRRLPSILYIDSMVDNLGFAVESLTKKIQCIKIPLEWRMLRVAKYVMRMIDAIMLATPAAGGGTPG